MQTLFNGHFSAHAAPSPQAPGPAPTYPAPKLLVRLPSWHRVFFGNLFDLLLFRRDPPLALTSQPAPFWPDVFVTPRLPVAALRQSLLYHVFLVTVLWGFSNTLSLRSPTLPVRSPFEHQTITYYSVSEYLPPINDAADSQPAKQAVKGEPAFAPQRIRSIRPNADSYTQTIVAPTPVKLPNDVTLPNIVAWTPVPSPVPQAAATHTGRELIAPALTGAVAPAPSITRPASQLRLQQEASVVEPAPVLDNARLRTPSDVLAKTVAEPAPTVEQARIRKPNLPLPSAVEPPPVMQNVPARLGDINMAASNVKVAAPNLPVPEQRARGSLVEGGPQRSNGNGTASAAVPPPPSLQGLGGRQAGGAQGAGQLIALGIRPVPASGPINVPQGNRTGTFAAGPEGKPGAAGTPEIKGGGKTDGPGGTGTSSQGAGGHSASGPAGITVEAGAARPSGNVVVAGLPTPQPGSGKTLLASLGHPTVADLARGTRPGAPSAPEPKVEDEVFGPKKYYQMTLNMPNLTSSGGSWIIRFAELNVTPERGELTAPVAVQKVDPAYSAELIRERVEGTVVLYAVIHGDGSVGQVRVLRSVDNRLDTKAREALLKWHFRPGTKNGKVVDLEAVVQIPFVARRLPF